MILASSARSPSASSSSDRQGVRCLLRWERDASSCWFFYKRLRAIDPEPDTGDRSFTTLSLGGDRLLYAGTRLRAAGIFQRDAETDRASAVAELTRPLAPTADLTFRYQFVDYDHRRVPSLDHRTHQLSLLASLAF